MSTERWVGIAFDNDSRLEYQVKARNGQWYTRGYMELDEAAAKLTELAARVSELEEEQADLHKYYDDALDELNRVKGELETVRHSNLHNGGLATAPVTEGGDGMSEHEPSRFALDVAEATRDRLAHELTEAEARAEKAEALNAKLLAVLQLIADDGETAKSHDYDWMVAKYGQTRVEELYNLLPDGIARKAIAEAEAMEATG